MSLLFSPTSTQRVVIQREAAIDDLANWSVMAWVYPTDTTTANQIFKKAHAKRFGNRDASSQTINIKQNYTTGVIQYAANVLTSINKWWCVCGTVNATRAFLYSGDLSTTLSEPTYIEQTATQSGGVESDATDPQTNEPGHVLWGNSNNRQAYGEAWNGRIGFGRWWSATLTIDELRREQFSFHPVRFTNLEGAYQFGFELDKIRDYSGKGRHGTLMY